MTRFADFADDGQAGEIPERVHYREADDPATSCATCAYYNAGHCSMFDADVSPSYVCDEWEAVEADHGAVTAAAPRPNSTMVCMKPRPDEAAAIADPDGEPADILHVTLAYLGDVEGDLGPITAVLARVAASHTALSGVVGGYGQFEPPGVGILLPDVPGLVELRVAVTEALTDAGIDYARDHGFEAHIAVDAEPEPDEMAEMLALAAQAPLHFDELLIVRGDSEVVPLPLTGAKPLTAAAPAHSVEAHNEILASAHKRLDEVEPRLARVLQPILERAGIEATHAFRALATDHLAAAAAPPPGWTSPSGSELLDVPALARTIRTKTDPIRVAFVKSVMTPALEAAGISWDVTNPLTAKVLAQAGSHIVSITQTTQADVMKVIAASYDQGLSIPDTAKAIQAHMKDTSFTRATLIARTELAGAVNGGSLAATQLVSDATGTAYYKKWLTAPGAMWPRHEEYDGLDGQTVQLEEFFDVGGVQLQFPGDPDGPPDEVCNCRCALSYTDQAGDLTDGGAGIDSGGEGE